MQLVTNDIYEREFKEFNELFTRENQTIPPVKIHTVTSVADIHPIVEDLDLLSLLLVPDVDMYDTIIDSSPLLRSISLVKASEDRYSISDMNMDDGTVAMIAYNTLVKGVKLRTDGVSWKHSINLHQIFSRRNISIKISNTNIQFCGSASEDNSIDIAENIVDRINQARRDLELIRNNREVVGGDVIKQLTSTPLSFNKAEYYNNRYIRNLWIGLNIESQLRAAIIRQGIGSRSSVVMAKRLSNILSTPGIISEEDVTIAEVETVMMKSSFRLRYKFSMMEFADYLDTVPGVRYTYDFDPSVKMEIKIRFVRFTNYTIQIETFTIASTFTVNQIGFGLDVLIESRVRFLNLVSDFLDNHSTFSQYNDHPDDC